MNVVFYEQQQTSISIADLVQTRCRGFFSTAVCRPYHSHLTGLRRAPWGGRQKLRCAHCLHSHDVTHALGERRPDHGTGLAQIRPVVEKDLLVTSPWLLCCRQPRRNAHRPRGFRLSAAKRLLCDNAVAAAIANCNVRSSIMSGGRNTFESLIGQRACSYSSPP